MALSSLQHLDLPKISICGLGDVRTLAKRDRFTHVISIWDAGEKERGPAQIKRLFPGAGFHVARFHDIEVASADAPTGEAVRAILEFGSTLSRQHALLVHCLAGISRSSAVAFVLACLCAGSAKEVEVLNHLIRGFPWILPNRRIVWFADELLGRDGRMMDAVEGIWKIRMGNWTRRYQP